MINSDIVWLYIGNVGFYFKFGRGCKQKLDFISNLASSVITTRKYRLKPNYSMPCEIVVAPHYDLIILF